LLIAGVTGTIVVAWTQLVGNGTGNAGFCECDFDDICGCP
jgi:hypothetical protein